MAAADGSPAGLSAVESRIVVEGVSKSFRRPRSSNVVEALRDVNLQVRDNTFVSLVGPSGCGKTTLLRLMNGLVTPDSGTVLVSGRVPKPGPGVGFVFQSFRLIPWATIAANVAFTMEIAGIDRQEREERTAQYLKLVGLSDFAKAYPAELSGGMKQRVALARALATEPEILLMDEPFASIDAMSRELMQIELMKIWADRKGVVVFVTHSIDEAIILSDQVIMMGPRPGRIIDIVDVDMPRPRWDYDVRAQPRFIELRNMLWNRIRGMVGQPALGR